MTFHAGFANRGRCSSVWLRALIIAASLTGVVTCLHSSAFSGTAMVNVESTAALMQVGSTNVPGGESFSVPISLVANGNENALGFSLQFDSSLLTYNGASVSGGASSGMLILNTNLVANGKLGVALAMPMLSALSAGTQEVLQVRFTAGSPNVSTQTSIAFGDQPISRELSDSEAIPLPANYDGGTVSIIAAAQVSPVIISGTVDYYAAGIAVPGTAFSVSGGASQGGTTSGDGCYSFLMDSGKDYSVTPVKEGDADPADGITALDLTFIRRHLLALQALDSPYKLLAADVNGSKSITPLDLTFIRMLVLGITNRFPAGLWRFVPSDYAFGDPAAPWNSTCDPARTFNNLMTDQTGQDFIAIKLGDVNGSWRPPSGGSVHAFASRDEDVATISVGSRTVQPGDLVTVPVKVSRMNRLTSLQFTLAWDPAVLRYEGLTSASRVGQSEVYFNSAVAGRLAVLWDDPAATLLPTNELLTVCEAQFLAVGTNGALSRIGFQEDVARRELTENFEISAAAWQEGTIRVEASQPRCIDVRIGSESAFNLTFRGTPGQTYTIESSERLDAPKWLALGTVTADASGRFEYVDRSPCGPVRFYRCLNW